MNHPYDCRFWHCCVALLAMFVLTGCGGDPVDQPVASEQTSELASEENSEQSSQPTTEPVGEADIAVADGEQSEIVDAPEAKPTQSAPQPAKQISAEAFRIAAYEGELETVRNAIESGGADVNGADPVQKLTALHMAAYNGHSEIVSLLLARDASVDCRDHEGKTPLIHACTGPYAKTVEILLDAGADINAQESTEGFTPLMMGAGLGQVEVVKLLLDRDADKTILDNDKSKRDSALDHAKNAGHAEIVKLLEQE